MGYVTPKIEIDLDRAISLWFQGKSTAQIGAELGVQREIVRRRLIESGIDTSIKRVVVNGEKPDNAPVGRLKPLEVLATIAYHAYGFSVCEIAEWIDVPRSTTQALIARGSSKLKARGLDA